MGDPWRSEWTSGKNVCPPDIRDIILRFLCQRNPVLSWSAKAVQSVVLRCKMGERDTSVPAFQRIPVAGRPYRPCYSRRIQRENRTDAESLCRFLWAGTGYACYQRSEDREGEICRCRSNLYHRSINAWRQGPSVRYKPQLRWWFCKSLRHSVHR